MEIRVGTALPRFATSSSPNARRAPRDTWEAPLRCTRYARGHDWRGESGATACRTRRTPAIRPSGKAMESTMATATGTSFRPCDGAVQARRPATTANWFSTNPGKGVPSAWPSLYLRRGTSPGMRFGRGSSGAIGRWEREHAGELAVRPRPGTLRATRLEHYEQWLLALEGLLLEAGMVRPARTRRPDPGVS